METAKETGKPHLHNGKKFWYISFVPEEPHSSTVLSRSLSLSLVLTSLSLYSSMCCHFLCFTRPCFASFPALLLTVPAQFSHPPPFAALFCFLLDIFFSRFKTEENETHLSKFCSFSLSLVVFSLPLQPSFLVFAVPHCSLFLLVVPSSFHREKKERSRIVRFWQA